MIFEQNVILTSLIEVVSLLQTCCLDEADDLMGQLCVVLACTLMVVFTESDVAQGFIIDLHIEESHADSTETVDPSWHKIDAVSEPPDATVELAKLGIADGETVDQEVVSRVLPESLSIVIDSRVVSSDLNSFQALLLPELDTVHVLDVTVQLEGVPE